MIGRYYFVDNSQRLYCASNCPFIHCVNNANIHINSISIKERYGNQREFPIITTDDVSINRDNLRSMFEGIQQDSVNVCISAVKPNIDGYPYYKNEKLELAPNYVCKELPIKTRITDYANKHITILW